MITDVCDPIAQSYKFMGTAQCQTEQFWFPKSKEPIYCKQSRKACYMSDIWERSLKMCQAQVSIWAAKHPQRKTNTKSDQFMSILSAREHVYTVV